ncbi:MAG: YvcK family protein [Candidatus Muirbacterium halophilum]|nr:YvcK family protein [Candidatus Muirbacterium halophilum]
MEKSNKSNRIKIYAFIAFLAGLFSGIFLFFLNNDYEFLRIFWIGALSSFLILLTIWFYIKKIRPVNKPDIIVKELELYKNPKVVLVGGGTGLSTVLKGIKNYASYNHENISAIVTVADDGGSSGKLRRELDIIAPGDIRNCIVALSKEETLLSKLFNFRFKSHGELSGHSFGNLFLAALSGINNGDFEKAVKMACDILAVKGKIIPASLHNVNIGAKFEDGSEIIGESDISEKGKEKKINRIFLSPSDAKANPEAVKALNEADVIILGPGSLYTSLIPNLLFPQLRDAIIKSRALKVFVCNIMTQPGETSDFSASDHIKTLYNYIPGSINFAIVNKGEMSQELLKKYEIDGAFPVIIDNDELKSMNILPVMDNILLEGDYLRHNSDKLAKIIIRLVEEYKSL